MAVQSGMDVINLSIGGGLGSWQEVRAIDHDYFPVCNPFFY